MNLKRPAFVAGSALVLGALVFVGYLDSANDSEIPGCGDDDVPVLAAPMILAASCPEPPHLSFKGRDYFVYCERVHPSRVGLAIATDGGETEYSGARFIVGVPSEAGFVMTRAPFECKDGERAVAFGDAFSDEHFEMMRRPLRREDCEPLGADTNSVTATPKRAAIGERVDFRGGCFFGSPEPDTEDFVGIGGMLGPNGASIYNAKGCPFKAFGEGRWRLTRDGSMRGYLIIPVRGRCRFEEGTRPVGPGTYRLIVGFYDWGVGNVRVAKK